MAWKQISSAGAVWGGGPQNGLAGLGWAGLQSGHYSAPISSVPFGRGPPGCGAAANELASEEISPAEIGETQNKNDPYADGRRPDPEGD